MPYLYAVSKKLQYGGDFAFNELAHGELGIIADYCDLFGLKKREQVINVLELLGMKPRIANKKPCPCECGRRLSANAHSFENLTRFEISPLILRSVPMVSILAAECNDNTSIYLHFGYR